MKDLRCIILDVDGVLTDGSITYDNQGNEYKKFFVRDGFAIKKAISLGIKVAIISGRNSKAVEIRCRELGIKDIFQEISNKLSVYESIKNRYKLADKNCAFMGDDVPDIPVLKKVHFSGAPADAPEYIKSIVSFVSKFPGGKGAVRDFIEYLLGGLM